MVNLLSIGNSVRSGYKTFKDCKKKISDNPLGPEIRRLRKEAKKWITGMDLIGREYHEIGETRYKIEENAINNLAVIEGVAVPYARYNILSLGLSKVYFYTDPKIIREIKIQDDDSLIEKIYPKPEKAVSSIEKVVEECLADSNDYGYVRDFKKRKREIIKELASIRKKIKAPYTPGTDYSSIQIELWQTAKKMSGVKEDYIAIIRDLETKSDIKNAKIAAAAVITLTVGILLGSKLKLRRKIS
jgi:hypothetical protein